MTLFGLVYYFIKDQLLHDHQMSMTPDHGYLCIPKVYNHHLWGFVYGEKKRSIILLDKAYHS